jgi:hypothetical protein
MILIAVLVAMALLAAAGYWWRLRPAPARPVASCVPRERFAAVEIRRRSGACAAAHALAGQRFLANQAPALPLVGCTKTRCECAFAKLSDRRTDDRRWGHEGQSAAMFLEAQRRTQADRRDTD